MGLRRKNKSPAVLIHEFIIENHADATSYLVVLFLTGFIFEVPAKFFIMFVAVQYNITYTTDDSSEQFHFYDYGPKDIATVFFYMLIAIYLHAAIQECILDKFYRSLNLSKTKHSKFNESGQLLFFYLFSLIWGASILNAEELLENPSLLWKDYPHARMLFQVKFFYICQLAYWFHAVPELYFQRIQKEDIPRQLCYICLYIAHISGAYILNLPHLGLILMIPHYLVELLFHASRLFYFSDENKQKGFTIWALLFIMVRLWTLTLTVLTFGFGLTSTVENTDFSIAQGNFNVLPVRIGCLGAVCLTQAWMMRKFINFHMKRWKDDVKNQIPKKNITNSKKQTHKKGTK
ncbi:TR1L1 protein, partial [Heliornis fulica]|nr:TR1L1 protein [Heliornis fulica]